MPNFREVLDWDHRVEELAEFLKKPVKELLKLFPISKEHFENEWTKRFGKEDPNNIKKILDYYAEDFYIIRQMSYPVEGPFNEQIVPWVETVAANGGPVLDYACGVGDYLIYWAKKGLEVWGIEAEGKATEFLEFRFSRRRLKLHLLKSTAENYYPKLPKKYFQNAFSINGLDHIDNPRIAARNMIEATKGKIYACPRLALTYDRPTHMKRVIRNLDEAFDLLEVHNNSL